MRLLLIPLLLLIAAPLAADELDQIYELSLTGSERVAMERLNNYLAISPREPRARFLKGLLLARRGDTTPAIELFTGLTIDYPELAEPHNNLAVLHAQRQDYEAALAALERAIALDPEYASAYANLGDLHLRLAARAYRRQADLEPDNDTIRQTLEKLERLAPKAPPESLLPPSPIP